MQNDHHVGSRLHIGTLTAMGDSGVIHSILDFLNYILHQCTIPGLIGCKEEESGYAGYQLRESVIGSTSSCTHMTYLAPRSIPLSQRIGQDGL
jgi:hypothetical protein